MISISSKREMYQVFFVAIWILRRAGASLYRSGLRGNVENRHGIILAKNQLTKVTGGKTGEAILQAQGKCLGPWDYRKYFATSSVSDCGIDASSIRLYRSAPIPCIFIFAGLTSVGPNNTSPPKFINP